MAVGATLREGAGASVYKSGGPPVLRRGTAATERCGYRERRKSRIDCLSRTDSSLKLRITPLASEAGYAGSWRCGFGGDAGEKWARMASSRSDVLPSCRKKMRWPTPQSGV